MDFDKKAREIIEERVDEWWAVPLTDEQRPAKLMHRKLQEMIAAALKEAYQQGVTDARRTSWPRPDGGPGA